MLCLYLDARCLVMALLEGHWPRGIYSSELNVLLGGGVPSEEEVTRAVTWKDVAPFPIPSLLSLLPHPHPHPRDMGSFSSAVPLPCRPASEPVNQGLLVEPR